MTTQSPDLQWTLIHDLVTFLCLLARLELIRIDRLLGKGVCGGSEKEIWIELMFKFDQKKSLWQLQVPAGLI